MRVVVSTVLGLLLLAACGDDPLLPIGPTLQPPRAEPPPADLDAPDDDPAEDVAPPDTPPLAPACGFGAASFDFPSDDLSCSGVQYVRFDARTQLFVGVVACESADEVRVYLSQNATGPFVQATDLAGRGEDHCGLVNPTFALTDEENITSGGCASCSVGASLALEGVPVWARGTSSEQFTFVAQSPEGSHRASRLRCGIDVVTCALAPGVEQPPAEEPPLDLPAPSSGVACSAGATVMMTWPLTAWDFEHGSTDFSIAGYCSGPVTFADDLADFEGGNMAVSNGAPYDLDISRVEFNGWTHGDCDAVHCATVRYPSGQVRDEYCTVWAVCDAATGLARASGFTW